MTHTNPNLTNPRILLTNDDGVDAPGLAILLDIARAISDDVWIVAPAHNQSGAGHHFTLGEELTLEKRSERVFAVDGTPADCVVTGCTHVLGDHGPDIVLSGVNHGQNLGDIIHCSGTVAGAREGAMQGVLSIALSQAYDYETNGEIGWDCARAFGASVVESLIEEATSVEGRSSDTYYNVNFPFGPIEGVPGVRVVPHQRFSRSPFRYYPSDNDGRFFVAVPETPSPIDEDFDFHVLHHERAITITPLTLLQTNTALAHRLETRIGRGARAPIIRR